MRGRGISIHTVMHGLGSTVGYRRVGPNAAGPHPPPLPGAKTVKRSVVVAHADSGRVTGQGHPRAKLTDADIDMIRALHEDGDSPLGYRQIARKFEVSVRTVRSICAYKRRASTGMHHSTGAPPGAANASPDEIERRFSYRLETLLNEIAGELQLHRNTVARVVHKRETVRREALRLQREQRRADKLLHHPPKRPPRSPAHRKKPKAKPIASTRRRGARASLRQRKHR